MSFSSFSLLWSHIEAVNATTHVRGGERKSKVVHHSAALLKRLSPVFIMETCMVNKKIIRRCCKKNFTTKHTADAHIKSAHGSVRLKAPTVCYN